MMPAPAREESPPAARRLPAIADAIGHCVLVFAFLPALAWLPGWVYFELRNPLNLEDVVVLTFIPVRGAILLLSAFGQGVVPGSLAGIACGVLLVAWDARGTRRDGRGGRVLVGAAAGVAAAALVVAATLAIAIARTGATELPWVAIAFELGSGLACGAIAGPTAMRLLYDG
jgi:hypothetical protein